MADMVAASGEQIARRAYDIYLARGREDGHDVEDWLAAEKLVREQYVASAPLAGKASETGQRRVPVSSDEDSRRSSHRNIATHLESAS